MLTLLIRSTCPNVGFGPVRITSVFHSLSVRCLTFINTLTSAIDALFLYGNIGIFWFEGIGVYRQHTCAKGYHVFVAFGIKVLCAQFR